MEFSQRGFMLLVLCLMCVTLLFILDKQHMSVVSPLVLERNQVSSGGGDTPTPQRVSVPEISQSSVLVPDSPVRRRNGLVPPPPVSCW